MKDIDEIRRQNLRTIEAQFGGPTGAASALGMSVAQFSNLRDGAKDSKTGKPRGMRKETARRIENGAGREPGWLDVDHTSPGGVQAAEVSGSAGESISLELALGMVASSINAIDDPEQREWIAARLQTLARAPDSQKALQDTLEALGAKPTPTGRPHTKIERLLRAKPTTGTAEFAGQPPAAVTPPHGIPTPTVQTGRGHT